MAERTGLLLALASPLLFGAGTAFSKALLADVHPVLMAGLLYLAAGIGLAAWRLANRSAEASLAKGDVPRLAAVALCGGVAAPALLMLALARWPASSASLALNLEAPLTAALAWALFREHIGRRTAAGIALIAAGCAVLGGTSASGGAGGLLVMAACLFWALDNNLTQGLSGKDPVQIAAAKGLVAGASNTAAAMLLGASLPAPPKLGSIALIGFLSYGVSLVCFLAALRRLGAARTTMYFSLAPFAGTGLAILVLREPAAPPLAAAAALMGAGLWLGARDSHEHEHSHEEEHEHLHAHDEHHRHHEEYPAGAHSHRHAHSGLRHSHPHVPDIHHRH